VGEVVHLGNGEFAVRGTHAYARRRTGSYVERVTVTPVGRPQDAISTTVPITVTQAPLTAMPHDFNATLWTPYRGAVALFQDDNALSPTENFRARIEGGDGTVTDENDTNNYSIWSLGKGLFAVKGGYAYTQMPSVGTTYTVSVTVHDLDSNVTRSAQSAATIRSPAALTGYGVNISPAKG